MSGESDLILLSHRDVRRVLGPRAAVAALREAYAQLASHPDDQGRALGFVVAGGSIHVKAGLLPGSRRAFAAKVNVNLPDNPASRGLPTIQGLVLLADARDGRPLAVIESTALTGIRTAAAAVLAAEFGARPGARRAAIVGCGAQAHFLIAAFRAGFALDDVRVFDIDRARAAAFAAAHGTPSRPVRAAPSVAEAVAGADICVTCTTSTTPVLDEGMKLDGCFVAAIGADNPKKHEIAPGLMRRAAILVDDLEACAAGGDLSHALGAGAVSRAAVRADLAALVAGHKTGRASPEELVIFDSTGSGVQDVAAAWAAYQEARRAGGGARITLADAGAAEADPRR